MPQAPPTAAGPSPTSLLSRFLNEHLPLQVLETQGPQDPSPSLTPGILMGQPGLSNVTRQRYPEQRWGPPAVDGSQSPGEDAVDSTGEAGRRFGDEAP